MKCSKEIIWELGAVLKSKGNLPVSYVGIYGFKNVGDNKFGFHSKAEAENLPGALLEMSMSKIIRGVDVISWTSGQYCQLAVWVEDSEDGETNIDGSVVDAFNKLEWKW